MNDFEFYLPEATAAQLLMSIGAGLGFYRPGSVPRAMTKTGATNMETAYNNRFNVVHSMSWRDDLSTDTTENQPEFLRVALSFSVRDRAEEYQTKWVSSYFTLMARQAGKRLAVTAYYHKPKEIKWDEDGTIIPLPEGFPDVGIKKLLKRIMADWPETEWIKGHNEIHENRAKPGPIPKTHEDKRKVVNAWNAIKHTRQKTLKEFLSELFGVYDDESPKVAVSTFYGWAKKTF